MGSQKLSVFRIAILVWIGLLSSAEGQSPYFASSPTVRIVMSSGVRGRFADPVCRHGETLTPAPFARYGASVLEAAVQRDEPFVFDTGGLLGPHGAARFGAERDPRAVAQLIRRLGYLALALGEDDLGAPRDPTLRVLEILKNKGVPVVLSNLHCEGEGQSVCDVVVDASDGVSMHRVADRRVAFLSFVGPAALQRISPTNAAGLRLSPVAEALAAGVRSARSLGASLVIAALDDGHGSEAVARAFALSELSDEDKPDILAVAGGGNELLFARPPGVRPGIVAAAPGQAVTLTVRALPALGVIGSAFPRLDVIAEPLAPSSRPAAPIVDYIQAIGDRYCAQWGLELAAGALSRPLDVEDLLTMLGDLMRMETLAEVSALHVNAVDPGWSPAHLDSLTASDLYLALDQDLPLKVTTVSGAWLTTFVKRVDQPRIRLRGVSVESGVVKVNGRDVLPRGRYRLVTVRYLARGGEGLFRDELSWRNAHPSLRDLIMEHLSKPGSGDPRDALPDMHSIPVWNLNFDSDLSFSANSVNNSADYSDSQFTTDETATFGIDHNFRWEALDDVWGWNGDLRVLYRTTRVEGDFEEALDITSMRTNARWRGLREDSPKFYSPEPFFEGYIETELSVPAESSFRHLLLRPTVGLYFALTEYLNFRVHGGFELEALDPNRDVLPGLGTQLQLATWNVLESGDKRIELAFSADWFLAGIGDENRSTFRGTGTSALVLNRLFSLGLGFNLFAVQQGNEPFAVASSTNIFFRMSWVGRAFGPKPNGE